MILFYNYYNNYKMSLQLVLNEIPNLSIVDIDVLAKHIDDIRKDESRKKSLEEFKTRRIQKIREKNNPFFLLKQIGEELYRQQNNYNVWDENIFEKVEKLKNDYSGKLGEKYIYSICKLLSINIDYEEDVNSKDGTYDVKINGKKVEIKTARMSNNGAFQHEGLRNYGCDYYLFLDIFPDKFYITILPKFDLNNACSITGRKPHLRKGSSDIFKFDFNEKIILNCLKTGYSLEINKEIESSSIDSFINKIIL